MNNEIKIQVKVFNSNWYQHNCMQKDGWEVKFDGKDLYVFTTLDKLNDVYRSFRSNIIKFYKNDVKVTLI